MCAGWVPVTAEDALQGERGIPSPARPQIHRGIPAPNGSRGAAEPPPEPQTHPQQLPAQLFKAYPEKCLFLHWFLLLFFFFFKYKSKSPANMKGWVNTPPFPRRNYKNAFEFVLARNNVFYERASLKSHNLEGRHLFCIFKVLITTLAVF